MAASPAYKVHTPAGEYVASAKTPALALQILNLLGSGAKVKLNGKVWATLD